MGEKSRGEGSKEPGEEMPRLIETVEGACVYWALLKKTTMVRFRNGDLETWTEVSSLAECVSWLLGLILESYIPIKCKSTAKTSQFPASQQRLCRSHQVLVSSTHSSILQLSLASWNTMAMHEKNTDSAFSSAVFRLLASCNFIPLVCTVIISFSPLFNWHVLLRIWLLLITSQNPLLLLVQRTHMHLL